MNILLVYPNPKGSYMLSTGIALLSACLKRDGHKVKLFDTTFYNETNIDGTPGKQKHFHLIVLKVLTEIELTA